MGLPGPVGAAVSGDGLGGVALTGNPATVAVRQGSLAAQYTKLMAVTLPCADEEEWCKTSRAKAAWG